MRNLVMATVLGLVVTSGLCAQSFNRGRGIMRPGQMKKGEEGSEFKRPPMEQRMRPVFAARGFAIGGEGFELFGINILPPKPSKEGVEPSEEVSEVDGIKKFERGFFGFAEDRYLLKNIEVVFEDRQAQDEDQERPVRKAITAITATIFKAPERKELNEEASEEELAEEELNTSTEDEGEGTLSIIVEPKAVKDRIIPILRGEATVAGKGYELYAVLGRGPKRMKRPDNRNFQDENEPPVDEEIMDEEIMDEEIMDEEVTEDF